MAQQYGVVAVCSVPMFLMAGAGKCYHDYMIFMKNFSIIFKNISGAVVFWVIGASFFVICLHASFYNFDALDLMDDQQELTGNIVEEV